jgi:hypothetical protein
MKRTELFILIMTGAAIITGCGAKPSITSPTAVPTAIASPTLTIVLELPPTLIISSAVATLSPAETFTSTPEPVFTPSEIPSVIVPEPTAAETPESAAVPTVDPNAAAIQVFAPGPMSKVSSPIDLRMYIAPRAAGLTSVEVYGEDGRLMARKVMRSVNYNNQFDKVIIEMPFETNAAAELGRLQISTKDSHGRVQAIKSVHVMLLSVGKAIITNPDYLRESVALVEPPLLHNVTGGEVTVQGTMQVFNELPVVIELIDEKGDSLGSRFIPAGPADGSYHDINTTIPYKVTKYTSARLVIRQSDDRIPGPFYLYSQEIFLSP